HEEKPIGALIETGYSYGATHGETILIPFERVLRALAREGILFRVELVVPQKLEQCSVELVSSRLGRSVDLSCCAPELGREDSGLHFELLQSIDRRQDHVRVEVDIRILHTIQCEVVERAPLACDRDILRCTRATLALILLSGSGEAIAHVSTERGKLKEVASVQRHLDDALVLDNRSDCCVLRRDERARTRNLNGLTHLSYLECEVESCRLLDLQFHVILCDGAKTRQLHFHVVPARLQARQVVYA